VISYLGVWSVADMAGTTPAALRALIHRHRDFPAPDAIIGAELTHGSVTWPAAGRPTAGWRPARAEYAASWVVTRRLPPRPAWARTDLYVSVAQLAARWQVARSTVTAALNRDRGPTPDAVIQLRQGRRTFGWQADRTSELDSWAAASLHRPDTALRPLTGPGRPKITHPTAGDITRLVEAGLSYRQVAHRTGLSHETVRTRYLERVGHRSGPSA
jgi:lambda repressor-like predicted transcriptional regulator